MYGRTRNPYDTNRIPGGSSGGEGCLLAAAGSPIGIGSDVGGSVRMPAFFNGIFGHKPSALIVSNKGQWPEVVNSVEDYALTLGPMCRFACDLNPMLKIMAGDNAHLLSLDTPVNLSSLKYFYQEDDGGELFVSPVDHDIRIAMDKVMRHVENGLSVKPKLVHFDKLRHSLELWEESINADINMDFEYELTNKQERINPYTELLKWCIGKSKQTIPAIVYVIKYRWGTDFDSPKHRTLVNECDELRREFEEILGDNGVFVYPTQPTVAPYHNEPIVRWPNHSYTGIFNSLGFPSTAVPLGIGPTERLPVGIQVVANRNQDRLCLAVASELERVFGGWVAPEIVD